MCVVECGAATPNAAVTITLQCTRDTRVMVVYGATMTSISCAVSSASSMTSSLATRGLAPNASKSIDAARAVSSLIDDAPWTKTDAQTMARDISRPFVNVAVTRLWKRAGNLAFAAAFAAPRLRDGDEHQRADILFERAPSLVERVFAICQTTVGVE